MGVYLLFAKGYYLPIFKLRPKLIALTNATAIIIKNPNVNIIFYLSFFNYYCYPVVNECKVILFAHTAQTFCIKNPLKYTFVDLSQNNFYRLALYQ